jgi:hypothetical protein
MHYTDAQMEAKVRALMVRSEERIEIREERVESRE